MARSLKLAEIAAAALAVVGHRAVLDPAYCMFALFAFGVISALFGPVKYGILPDHLERKELPRANAWIESGTFAAILGGTIVGGIASAEGTSVALLRTDDDGAGDRLLAGQPLHPAHGLGCSGPCHRQEHSPLHLAPRQRTEGQAAPLDRRADDLLVLAGRRHRPVHPADPGEEQSRRQRNRRDRLSRGVRHRHRRRLGDRGLDVAGPHRAPARPCRDGFDGLVRA